MQADTNNQINPAPGAKNPRIAFTTLGCRVNQYDTQAMRERFLEAGFEEVGFKAAADVYVVNTCTVTATSDQKSRQMIARAHRKNPQALIVVTGCFAQRLGERALEIDGVGLVIGTERRASAVRWTRDALESAAHRRSFVADLTEDAAFEPLSIHHMAGRTRSVMKIQEGCDKCCTYCIIPSVRGPVRSRSMDDCIEEARRLAEAGVPEIILTGIHLASYGMDLGDQDFVGQRLARLLKELNDTCGIVRIRMGSVDPELLNEPFLAQIASLRAVCRHMHVSMQSGSAGVLKRMGRRYTPAQYEEHIGRLRAIWPDAAVSTDVMTGFPGETEEEFSQTLRFVRKIGFTRLHVFPYSQREGTPAEKMRDQVPAAIREARARALIAVGQAMTEEDAGRRMGGVEPVLVERSRDGFAFGRTQHDYQVKIPGQHERGSLVSCRIDGWDGKYLLGIKQ
ncbi:MAG: tRNA (N(6)-L-threonylcarbamoyladenosine(37)-C(2))-methylthiotransferase MtaB [Christensenellales bacterium]|jgi:threonylcarbamoyladenosine tRNA methylthiotransferase MtaB